MEARKWTYRQQFWEESAHRRCDHPGCDAVGEYKAPRSRDRLTEYYYFCLEHVRDYNKTWNYFQGLSAAEMEQSVRADTVWQRRTKPLGGWRVREDALREAARRAYDEEGAEAYRHSQRAGAAGDQDSRDGAAATELVTALAVLDLTPPAEFAAIKFRYKELVKRHHPDANGGCKQAEETLKNINQAFAFLKTAYLA